MKSSSTIFVERDAVVVVDITSMRTCGLTIVSGSLLVAHSQTRLKLILHFFGHHILVFQLMCVFSRFSLPCFSIYWVIAESETQVCLSCKINPDASAVSESGEEGGQNPKSVDQLSN